MEGAGPASSSAPSSPPSSIDPRSGFCAATKTFHSLRPPVPLPPSSQPLSVTSYVFSLLSPSPPQGPAFFSATGAGASLSFPEFLSQVRALASSLRSRLGVAKGDVAFVLSPARLEVPVLYFALLAIGAIVSPSNPAATPYEISYQFQLTNPAVAFTTSAEAGKLPRGANTVLLDSPEFRSLLAHGASSSGAPPPPLPEAEVRQSDPAAVLYSSGTTGPVKAVVLSHRNFIALIAVQRETRPARESPAVHLITVPVFHVFGFVMLLQMTAFGEASVLMERFELAAMLQAVERYQVSFMPVSPPLIVAMLKSDAVAKHDLSSLEAVRCGGAPLGREVAERFAARFPHIEIVQGYGLTESGGGVASNSGPEENQVYGSTGRLQSNMEAKIVDPSTGQALPPGQQGELWLRGPTIMQGYLGDHEATASTLDPEGWLKTGDLCYFNEDGFLFVVDRLKELIKYKAYQVPPAELEHILLSHPEIADAAVVPYPDEEAGQIPMAFVVRRHGSSLSGDQVIKFVAKHVAPYKRVRQVSFIESIPKSAAGKILRRELVNLAVSGSASKL